MRCISICTDEKDKIYTYSLDYNRLSDKLQVMKKFANVIMDNILLDVENVEIYGISSPGESDIIPLIEYNKEKLPYICKIIEHNEIDTVIFKADFLGDKVDIILKIKECIVGVVHRGCNNIDALLGKLQMLSGLVENDYTISIDEFSKVATDYIDDFENMTEDEKNNFINIVSQYSDLYAEFTVCAETGLVVDDEYAVKVAGYSAEILCIKYNVGLAAAYLALAIMKTNLEKGLMLLENK